MPSGQFYTVVISVSDILPLDKGHYISVNGTIISQKNDSCLHCLLERVALASEYIYIDYLIDIIPLLYILLIFYIPKFSSPIKVIPTVRTKDP